VNKSDEDGPNEEETEVVKGEGEGDGEILLRSTEERIE
jgi:hypothetical protein